MKKIAKTSEGMESAKKSIRKPRAAFTIEKDIALMKSALQNNPWQLGDNCWGSVVQEFKDKYSMDVTNRTVKSRINHLLAQYEKQEFTFRTGTEEQVTERGVLLDEIRALVAEASTSINEFIDEDSLDQCLPTFEEQEVIDATKSSKFEKAARRRERLDANKERDEILENMVPEPTSTRKKRQKYCMEDEMILKKQEHDCMMDTEKLQLEKERLDLDLKREERITEEGRRRDEIATSQLNIQNQMLTMMGQLIEKLSK